MLTYILLYAWIIFGSVLVYKVSKAKNRKRNVALFCSVAVISIIALRHPSMGLDLQYGENKGYLFSYNEISGFSWSRIFEQSYLNYEKGYVILNKLLSLVCTSTQFLLITCALLSLIPVFLFFYKNSASFKLSLVIYMALPIFTFVFSGLRQAIAIGICCIALKYANEKKLLKFIVCIAFSMLFHTTSVLFLLAYPLMNIKFKMSHRWLSLVLLVFIFLFKEQIYNFAISLFGKTTKPDNNGSIIFFLVITAIYVFCFIFSDKTRKNEGYLNLLFVACVIQAVGGVQNTVIRAGYYFMPVIAVLIPNVVDRFKNSFERNLIKSGIVVVFAAYGLFALASSEIAMSNPHHFFWEVI